MIKFLLAILFTAHIAAEEPTFSTQLGYYIEDVLDRNEMVSKYFNTDAFLLGFDKALANESVTLSKEELCKYFEPGNSLTEERKAIYSEACGHYVVLTLKGKDSKDIIFKEIRAGIVAGKKMDELPSLSNETKAKYLELLDQL